MITSTSNSQIKWVRGLQTKRSAREEESVFVVEGTRLLKEVAQSQQQVHLILHSPNCSAEAMSLIGQPGNLGAKTLEVSDHVMKVASSLEHPPGVLAIVSQPSFPVSQTHSLVLLLDQISDPGNMGSILRSALATGVELIMLTPGTVDLYNPKVVRGGMGAHLYVPTTRVEIPELRSLLKGMKVWSAEPGTGIPYYNVDWREPVALIIGSEAHGPSPLLRKFINAETFIPISEKVESLNAAIAASIILFEVARQRGAQ